MLKLLFFFKATERESERQRRGRGIERQARFCSICPTIIIKKKACVTVFMDVLYIPAYIQYIYIYTAAVYMYICVIYTGIYIIIYRYIQLNIYICIYIYVFKTISEESLSCWRLGIRFSWFR